MTNSYFADQTFKNLKSIKTGDYENCRFINCILPNSDLSGISFIECEFQNCDFSSSKLYDASFKTASFVGSKLVGLQFEDSTEFLFSIDFRECNLHLSSFYQMNPKSISFRDCNLKEVDLTEANLAETLFEQCDLNLAIFKNTNLEKADLSSSYNYIIDPEINNIQKAKFSLQGLPGLLEKYNLEIN